MAQRIQTLVLKFSAPGTVDLPQLQMIRDVTFWNPIALGTSNDAQIIINGVSLDILPGDPMLSFGGYDFIERNDVIEITFSGSGVNNLIVFANKVIDV